MPRMIRILVLLCTGWSVSSSAQTFTTLVQFNGTNGSQPYAPVIQGSDGRLYGATFFGGANHEGTIFRLGSVLTTLYNFCPQPQNACPDGVNPWGVVQGKDGNFYGVASQDGNHFAGSAFMVTPTGQFTMLYAFCSQGGSQCTDGKLPQGSLILGTDGNLYGTASEGGTQYGGGTVFRLTTSGQLTTLYSFCTAFNCTDGAFPHGVFQANDGNFYGTTAAGGPGQQGTVFQLTPTGTLTTLHTFCSQSNCADGQIPQGTLVQGTDGNLYGTASQGGNGSGTVFKITLAGQFSTLYTFCSQPSCADGATPMAGLILASDGNFYGTTSFGGATNHGTIFRLSPTGKLTTLYNFCSQGGCADGYQPQAPVVQAKSGILYGTTLLGGLDANGFGTVFSLVLPAEASLSVTSMNFGQEPVLIPSTPQFSVLKNIGYSALSISSIAVTGTDPGDYSQTNNCGTSLPAGKSCSISVTFAPTATGLRQASITITDSASDSPQSISLTGSGITVATTTVVTTSGSPSYIGQTVTFTATVSSGISSPIPNGETVTFYDNGSLMGTGTTLGGVATYTTSTLPAKSQTIKASYAGDPTFRPSSGSVTQVVNLYPSTTTLASTPNPSSFGQPVTLTATVTSSAPGGPTGSVQFYNGSTKVGGAQLSGGITTFTTSQLPLGKLSLTATYTGDSMNSKSTSAVLLQTVQKATVAMSLTSSPNPSKQGQSVAFVATLTSTGSLPNGQTVNFLYNGSSLGTATISSGKAHISTTTLPVGSDVVTAQYAGSVDYSAASATTTQTVN